MIFVAPTEPPGMKVLGKVSGAPEQYGVDVLWASQNLGGLVGVQRKEIGDLVASVQDGRLAKEIIQMARLKQAALMVEGRLRWSTEGELMGDRWTRWNRVAHRNLLRSFMAKGIWVEHTDDIGDTVESCRTMEKYLEKERHDTLLRRPKPRGQWGVVSDREWASHLLQAIPSVGPGQAEKILDAFDGRLPVAWTCGIDDLLAVPGVGKVKAQKLWDALQHVEIDVTTPLHRDVAGLTMTGIEIYKKAEVG